MQGRPRTQQACCIAGILADYVMSHRSTLSRQQRSSVALITLLVPLRFCKSRVVRVDDNGSSMNRQWARPFTSISRALLHFLQRSVPVLTLLKCEPSQSRMSWVFGVKPRASPSEKNKSVDSSEKAVEKLQAYHELAKVVSAHAPIHLHHHKTRRIRCRYTGRT